MGCEEAIETILSPTPDLRVLSPIRIMNISSFISVLLLGDVSVEGGKLTMSSVDYHSKSLLLEE